MWTPQAARSLAYKAGVILNAGLAGAPVDNAAIEAGGLAPPTSASAALVAYMRVSEPRKGDELEVVLKGPGGTVLARDRQPPLARDEAQHWMLAGRKRPPTGWPAGRYEAEFKVWRGGKAVLQKSATITL